MSYDNWGHVYGLVFNEFKYNTFIKALIDSKNRKEVFTLDNKENEVLFIYFFHRIRNRSHRFYHSRICHMCRIRTFRF